MTHISLFTRSRCRHAGLAALLAAACLAGPAGAGKDDAPGQQRKAEAGTPQQAKASKAAAEPREARIGAYFTLADRDLARQFYDQRFAQTRACPPGLAKKNNGCLPPGQARKYGLGQPLPRDVVLYPLPRGVLLQLPPVPAGHEYVRVAGDILLITLGTQLVVDALTDLVR